MDNKRLKARIEELGRKLGISESVYKTALPEFYEDLYKSVGARTWDERKRIHNSDIIQFRDLPMIVPGANIAAVSHGPDGKYYILVQARNNGETREEDKKIGVPGGASNLWGYNPYGSTKTNVVLEHPLLTAYREWKEEVGIMLQEESLSILTIVTTTNEYRHWPNAYAFSVYYYIELPWDRMQTFMLSPNVMNNQDEGRILIIPVKELPKYDWFPDAEECFELIMGKYS